MDKKQAERLAMCLERFLNQLNSGLQEARFSIHGNPMERHIAFSISEKLSIEARIKDPETGMLLNRKVHKGPTHQMCEVILLTSVSDDEIIERWRLWTFDKVDTTRNVMQASTVMTPDIEKLVADKVAAILEKEIGRLMEKQITAAEAARSPIELRVAPPKVGLQEKPKREPVRAIMERTIANNRIWAERAKMIGMGPPIKAAGSNGIARKWLKEAEKKWAAHEATLAAAALATAGTGEPQPAG